MVAAQQIRDVNGRSSDAVARQRASSIELRGLSKSYDDVEVLKNLDLHINAGEFFTLLGPSGSGKSTILRLVAGFERPDTGSIRIGGTEVVELPPNRRNVNTVFQSYALFAHLSVRDNMAFGPRMLGWKKDRIGQRVQEMAAFINIAELLGRRIDQLSGGQRQRVALARALINEPDVLLLDEPLSALDAGLRSQLQVELRRIQRRLGMTFVFVTHDQEEALVMSDRIAVLNDGHLQQVSAPQALYERPQNLFVARFMGHSNVFPISARASDHLLTPLGRISGQFGAGSHVLVRPEAITVRAQPQGDANHFPATVSECIYRGDFVEYRMQCGAARLTAKRANRGEPLFEVGAQVSASVASAAVVLLDG